MIVLGKLELSKEQLHELFSGLILKYCQIFASVQSLVFDLGPYLGYLNETGEESSAVLKVFTDAVAEIGEAGDKGRRARVLINMTKMRSMLGYINELEQIKEVE